MSWSIYGVDMSIPESLCLLGVDNLCKFGVYTGQELRANQGHLHTLVYLGWTTLWAPSVEKG